MAGRTSAALRLLFIPLLICSACDGGGQDGVADGSSDRAADGAQAERVAGAQPGAIYAWQGGPAGALTVERAQALVDDHTTDVLLVVTAIRQEAGRTIATADVGTSNRIEVEFEEAQGAWRFKTALVDDRPVPEQTDGLSSRDLVRSLEELRLRNTISGMRYIAEGLAKMHRERGRYASSLEELAELGYTDRVRLDETVTHGTDVVVMREYPNSVYFPVGAFNDGWWNPWRYDAGEETYTLTSTGWDGAVGPWPPDPWLGPPFAADLIMVEGEFVQAPRIR